MTSDKGHFKHGYDPRRSDGRGGNKKGRSGRKPDEFKRRCRNLTMSAVRKYVRRILRNPNHRHFMAALKWTAAYGYGRPRESVTVEHRTTLEELVVGSRP